MTARTQLLVMAKAPIPGRVKTRLCPPCTPRQAALIAAAALWDTLDTADATPAARRVLVLDGCHRVPPGWRVTAQHGEGLDERLTAAFLDTAVPDRWSLLIGMDTPQVTVELLETVAGGLATADAVVGPALDGGWWALALRDPHDATALTGVPMSRATTCAATIDALRRRGLRVVCGPYLSDVDTADDAAAVAATAPNRRFAAAVREHLPVRRFDEARP
jgi:uncharacterized protein